MQSRDLYYFKKVTAATQHTNKLYLKCLHCYPKDNQQISEVTNGHDKDKLAVIVPMKV